jgi:hypothetical protein
MIASIDNAQKKANPKKKKKNSQSRTQDMLNQGRG